MGLRRLLTRRLPEVITLAGIAKFCALSI